MNIITLFCEIDDFFLAYEKWQATQSLPRATPLEDTRTSAKATSERGDDAPHCLP